MAQLFVSAVPSAPGSCVPSVSHCLANESSSSHCLASIYNIYSICLAEASSYSEIAQASSYSYADRALELGKSAATWQLVVALYVALLVLRMHGRFILWSWLTMLLFFLHALFVVYQITIVAVNITLVSALNIFANLFKLYAAAARWIRGGNIRRRYRAIQALNSASTWAAWSAAAAELDALDGKADWRAAPESGSYDGASVVALTAELAAARKAGDAEELVRLVRSLMQRNHLNVDAGELHRECRVGSKLAIEAYIAEVVAALRYLEATADLSLGEKRALFERCEVCLGHTALCLSGGGSLAMYHMGVVKALIEAGQLPSVVSGASGGAIVAGVLAVNTDQEGRLSGTRPRD